MTAMPARRIPIVAPALAVALVIAFAVRGGGAAAALIAQGASWGPRTLGGEPWRVATSALVHLGWLQVLVNAAVVLGAGAALERWRGRAAVVIAFVAGATLGTAAGTLDAPYAVIAGASNGALGVAGALAVALARGWRDVRARWLAVAGLAAIAAGAIGLAVARDDVTHVGHAVSALAGVAVEALGGRARSRAGQRAAIAAAALALGALLALGRPAPRDPHAATVALARVERRFDALVGPADAPAPRSPALVAALEAEVVAPLAALAAPDATCVRLPRALAAACVRRTAYAAARLAAIRAFVAYLRTGERARRDEAEAASRAAEVILTRGPLP